MIEYIYCGFKISYEIEPVKNEANLYKAAGHATYLLNNPKSFTPISFRTEYDTHAGTEHEIRKMLENYVNFELKNFYDLKQDECRIGAVSG